MLKGVFPVFIEALNKSAAWADLFFFLLVNFRVSLVIVEGWFEELLLFWLVRQLLVFAILWMGTRDIIVALLLTCIFMVFADYLFNDNSMYCIIPSKYKTFKSSRPINKYITFI